MTHTRLKNSILTAEFAVILAIFSQLTLPLGLIPLTGQTFAVGLIATILGPRYGSYTIGLYILLGLLGLPVFAGMAAGLGTLFGPTGGYIWGFFATTLITGTWVQRRGFHHWQAVCANLCGALGTLIVGSLWLVITGQLSLTAAFTSGLVPFLLPALIKGVAAAYCGGLLYQRLPQLRPQKAA
ncbi:biotin transporter BioY [Loigolactobacillus bifermentans]|uniref:Biotin transporter n=1 Tax=Loigolactobacillus bifermentans DSM 20003 TaxID=1423726 RepID=A0A0R1H789_9LACO|nr:biotin transporter BioY [Loigolactobacillus bifermentans]KRK40483.1 hypothetical protein FC07_GL000494 [Loigolactobacillus bifermentans DSM 20003]QGG59795.1 biotin transporter BioY [Loigolactobacillus bifermentans]